MNRLNELKALFDKEYSNVKKSKNNGKSLKLIQIKKKLFADYIQEFKEKLTLLKDSLESDLFNKLVDEYAQLKTKRDAAYTILDASSILL